MAKTSGGRSATREELSAPSAHVATAVSTTTAKCDAFAGSTYVTYEPPAARLPAAAKGMCQPGSANCVVCAEAHTVDGTV